MGRNNVSKQLSADQPLEPVGDPQDKLVYYVNGVNTSLAKQMQDMKNIAGTHRRVIGIHNATHGLIRDLAQTLGDKFSIGKNPAVDTVKNLLRQAVHTGMAVSLLGHSQGASICCRALWEVKDELLASGMSEEQIKQSLAAVDVETAGGVSIHYPDGPHYHHIVNTYDPVPRSLGLNSLLPTKHAGAGAIVESKSLLHKPYLTDQDNWWDLLPNAVDRSVHGTEVYYGLN